MFNDLPILGVCGWSGSGKTTLLEKVLPSLLQRGLKVAVVKHDTHGIAQDASGKDSQRLFVAGADVILHGPDQSLARCHSNDEPLLETSLAQLAEHYDLILVEGYKRAQWQKVWLAKSDDPAPPTGITNLAGVLPWDADRVTTFMEILERFLQEAADRTPVYGCILIGGKSSRMGSPKHLLPCADCSGQTWLHRTVGLLEQFCQKVVLAGDGTVPVDLRHLPCLIDPPDAAGPLAGLLAVMRWAPRASWLLSSCDLPGLSGDALKWLLTQRRPGAWAVLPCFSGAQHVEPLLAWYDFRCRWLLEQLAAACDRGLQDLARHQKSLRMSVPVELSTAWNDVDTPQADADHAGAALTESGIKPYASGRKR